jgi:uncharacterized iron-regulated membrane protein
MLATTALAPQITILKNSERAWKDRSGLPNVRALDTLHDTAEAAHADAKTWCARYETSDPYGNIANVLGVTQPKDGKWVGVVSHYHSCS